MKKILWIFLFTLSINVQAQASDWRYLVDSFIMMDVNSIQKTSSQTYLVWIKLLDHEDETFLLKELDFIGWSDWKVEAKDLMRDFSLGMAVLDRIRIEQGRESWRTWIRSAGWLQATILGHGVWGEKLIDLLEDGSLNRFGTLGVISDPTLLSEEDQVRILLVDSREHISPEIEKWIRGNGQSLSFILTPKLPEKMEIPALWLEIAPGEFFGGLEELLYELLEGCCPFGLINNGFSDLLPYFQRPYEGIGKMIWSDEEEWLESITEDILGNVGWESKWAQMGF